MGIDEAIDEIGKRLEKAEAEGDEDLAQFLDRILTAILINQPRSKMWRQLPDVLSCSTLNLS